MPFGPRLHALPVSALWSMSVKRQEKPFPYQVRLRPSEEATERVMAAWTVSWFESPHDSTGFDGELSRTELAEVHDPEIVE